MGFYLLLLCVKDNILILIFPQTLLRELNLDGQHHKIAELAVSLALDRHDPHRELTSRLIADLNGVIVNQHHLTKGFDGLLNNLQDLTLDTPDAPTVKLSRPAYIPFYFCISAFTRIFYNIY